MLSTKKKIIIILLIILAILFIITFYSLYNFGKKTDKFENTLNSTTTNTNTTIPLDCNSIGLQFNLDTNTIQNQCNSVDRCYYVNGSCYDKLQFAPVSSNSVNNNFTCQIQTTPKGNGYLLQCPNIDKSIYLFTNISENNDCVQTDTTCNLIAMSNPNLLTQETNLLPKLATLEYINGSLPKPLFLSNVSVQKLTNNFDNLSGNLFFTDIYDNTMKVPYNVVPAINAVQLENPKLLYPNTNLISQIQNLNSSVMQNLNLLSKI